MLIQYVLVASSLGVLVLVLRRRSSARTAAGTKLAFLFFVGFGIYAVLRPPDVQIVADWLGVGRGADLLLYALVVAFTFATLSFYLRFKELEVRYACLARAIALQHPEPPADAKSESAAT